METLDIRCECFKNIIEDLKEQKVVLENLHILEYILKTQQQFLSILFTDVGYRSKISKKKHTEREVLGFMNIPKSLLKWLKI